VLFKITSRLAVESAFDDLPPGWHILDVRGVIDGPGNAKGLVDGYVASGTKLLRDPAYNLVVVFDYGQSRSNIIAARILPHLNRTLLADSIKVVEPPPSQELSLAFAGRVMIVTWPEGRLFLP
jgi:hypothetical protein